MGDYMKKSVILSFVIVLFSVFFIPVVVNGFFKHDKDINIITEINDFTEDSKEFDLEKTFYETDFENDKLEEYIIGVVAAEMPALFEYEALKAQAVASRTYAVRSINDECDIEDMKTDGGQAYISVDEMKNRWKENFDIYYERIKNAVFDTKGEIMVYDNEPILAVFHAISNGMTEESQNIWNKEMPYLKSVESRGDIDAQGYIYEEIIPLKVCISKLSEYKDDFVIGEKGFAGQCQVVEKSYAGYIKKIKIGNTEFTGREIRGIFGLRSTCFTVEQRGEDIAFITKGYGHGAGMSQYGANSLAKEGMKYTDILKHYYTGTEFKTIN